MPSYDRLAGTLLGTALGDALGLPAEGLSARTIARRFGRMDRFRLVGSTGFVSDDTEQSALIAQSLARCPSDPKRAADAFRRSLIGWFLRLPFGIGKATLQACVRAMFGLRPSGIASAGNGAAMRAAIIGAVFADDPPRLAAFSDAIAVVTHTDPRAVAGARYVAAVAASCCRSQGGERDRLVNEALASISEQRLVAAIEKARMLAASEASLEFAVRELGNTGFVMHTVPYATFCFLRFRGSPLDTLAWTIAGGGDTDSIGAIVGAWLGALHGEQGLPADLLSRLHDGPFGPTHLRSLARALADPASPPARYSPLLALLRNGLVTPVILAHGIRRLWPL